MLPPAVVAKVARQAEVEARQHRVAAQQALHRCPTAESGAALVQVQQRDAAGLARELVEEREQEVGRFRRRREPVQPQLALQPRQHGQRAQQRARVRGDGERAAAQRRAGGLQRLCGGDGEGEAPRRRDALQRLAARAAQRLHQRVRVDLRRRLGVRGQVQRVQRSGGGAGSAAGGGGAGSAAGSARAEARQRARVHGALGSDAVEGEAREELGRGAQHARPAARKRAAPQLRVQRQQAQQRHQHVVRQRLKQVRRLRGLCRGHGGALAARRHCQRFRVRSSWRVCACFAARRAARLLHAVWRHARTRSRGGEREERARCDLVAGRSTR
jgi:hypothetical protein